MDHVCLTKTGYSNNFLVFRKVLKPKSGFLNKIKFVLLFFYKKSVVVLKCACILCSLLVLYFYIYRGLNHTKSMIVAKTRIFVAKRLRSVAKKKPLLLNSKDCCTFYFNVAKCVRKLYLNDNKDVITDLLLENYQQGDDKDYVKLTDIKNTLKQGGIKEKDVISIKKLVEETFSEVEFREISSVDKKRIRNFFLKLKLK
ncbi:hypothetical protein EB118_08940 [bacterium]|nr:hypothetical protein [bacterium]